MDQASDCLDQLKAAQSIAIGTDVHTISAQTGEGLPELDLYLQPEKTVVLVGSSGVGKSTLINRLAGKEMMETQEIREKDGRGRHTTSHRQLFQLGNGTKLIDTPGMREVGMWDVSQGLEESFADVEAYFGKCKFKDCHHQSEPNCAIKEALRNEELSPERWESYLKLHTEAKYTKDKTAYLREKEVWLKDISKFTRQLKIIINIQPVQKALFAKNVACDESSKRRKSPSQSLPALFGKYSCGQSSRRPCIIVQRENGANQHLAKSKW